MTASAPSDPQVKLLGCVIKANIALVRSTLLERLKMQETASECPQDEHRNMEAKSSSRLWLTRRLNFPSWRLWNASSCRAPAHNGFGPERDYNQDLWDHTTFYRDVFDHKPTGDPCQQRKDERQDKVRAEDLFYHFALRIFKEYSKLEVLAFGDFSYNGRYEDSNLLLARDKTDGAQDTFRVISTQEINDWTGVKEPLDFLSSCPVTDMFEA